MEKKTLYRVDVVGIGELNLDTVGNARWAFAQDENGREPDTLVMSPLSYNQLKINFNPSAWGYNGLLADMTFMGLKLEVDSSFRDGEWRVRREMEKTYAIKG